MTDFPLSFHWFNHMNRWIQLAYTTYNEKNLDMYLQKAKEARMFMETHLALETVAARKAI